MEEIVNEIEDSIEGTSYSGTFRWKANKSLPKLPPISPLSNLIEPFNLSISSGWRGYFYTRGQYSSYSSEICDEAEEAGQKLVDYALKNLCLVDCMSFPLSIAHILSKCEAFDKQNQLQKFKEINILCIGCSQRAEERILRQSNAFEELLFLLPSYQQIHLWLIGPEISQSSNHCKDFVYNGRIIDFHLFQGNIGSFFRSHSYYLNTSTVIFGFNCGFGNFENPLPRKFDLLLSWLIDLLFLTGTNLPLFFLCANHYADVTGEISIMYHILGAKMILLPQENPFSFASTLIPPETAWKANEKPKEFSRGNAYFYGVQSNDRYRRKKLNVQAISASQNNRNSQSKNALLLELVQYLNDPIDYENLLATIQPLYLQCELATTIITSSVSFTSTTTPADRSSSSSSSAASSSSSSSSSQHPTIPLISTIQHTTEETKAKDITTTVPNIEIEDKISSSTSSSSSLTSSSKKKNKTKKNQKQTNVVNNNDNMESKNDVIDNSTDKNNLIRHEEAKEKKGDNSDSITSPLSAISVTVNSISVATTTTTTTTAAMQDQSSNLSLTSLSVQPPSSSLSLPLPSSEPALNSFFNDIAKTIVQPESIFSSILPSSSSVSMDMEEESLHIEQSLLLEKKLQLLISTKHTEMPLNQLSLNLHTSGQRLHISLLDSDQWKIHKEVVLIQEVDVISPSAFIAKYSKKKNLLTVTFNLKLSK
jgi:hypothetical protein